MFWCSSATLNAVKDELKADIERLRLEKRVVSEEKALSEEVVRLKKEVVQLGIDKARVQEDQAKRERELTHMVGLEKKRQEQELALNTREITVKVREENLTADKARFEAQMDFHDKRFTEETRYLKDLMGQILSRLPTITVDRAITADPKKAK